MKILALKIDVDTQKGYRLGVPALLDLFDTYSVRASFFFSMGPENLPSFLARLRKDNLLTIISTAPGIIRDADRRGHDCALHAWNPQEWRQNLDRLPVTTLEATLRKAVTSYIERIGRAPKGFAAPGWKINDMSLRIENELGFSYCSDTLGFYPYIPKLGRKVFSTLQIPSTLPPMDFVRREYPLYTDDQLAENLLLSLSEGLNVLSIRAETEGLAQIRFLEKVLKSSQKQMIHLMDLLSITNSLRRENLPVCTVDIRETKHSSHEIAVQGSSTAAP